MQTIIASIIIFGLIIFVHEFGHYLVAKLTGIRVEEFSLGMGPKVIGKKWGETLYSIRALPLGGFCKMTGETGSDEYRPVETHDLRRFDQKPIWVRMSVIFAGPLMNFLLAIVLFTMIFAILGMPQDLTTKIGSVVTNEAADSAGLKPGDRIVQINDEPVDTWRDLVAIIHTNAGNRLKLTVEREGNTFEVQVVPRLDPENNVGIIGITPDEIIWENIGIIPAIKIGLERTYEITRLTIVGLLEIITGKTSAEGIAGPVGILQLIGESARFGLIYLVNLTALISINLGLLNLLPIPALDGSRLFFLGVEALRGRPVNPAKENFVHLVGFVLLMILMVIITYRDILRIFG